MKFILIIAMVLMGCSSTPSSIVKLDEHNYNVTGKLDKTQYDEIITIVKTHQNETINFYVYSLGGTSRDLFEAMDIMYTHGDVHWYSENQCDSACAVMALSTKHAEGKFRLHSFYRREHHQVYAAPEFNKLVLERLRSYGYDADSIRYMFDSVENLCTIYIHDGNIFKNN